MPRVNRRELARRIRQAVLALREWKIEPIGEGRVLTTMVGNLYIWRTTPAARAKGMPAPHGIDI